MKKMSKLFTISFFAIIVSLCLILTASAVSISEATSNFYVNDFADVLSKNQEEELMERAVELASKDAGVQVVITTVKSLENESINSYANKMYNQYKIGKDDRGILILLAVKDREIRLEVGRGLEEYITDSKAGSLIDDYAIPSFKENDFANGIINLQTAIISKIDKIDFSKNAVNTANVADTSKMKNRSVDIFVVTLVIALAIVILLVCYMFKHKPKSKKEIIKEKESKINALIEENKVVKEQYQDNIQILENKIKNLNKKNSELYSTVKSNETKYSQLQKWQDYARKIDKNVDAKIVSLLSVEKLKNDRQVANTVDGMINQVLGSSNVTSSRYSRVICEYNALTADQKSLVIGDINKVKDLFHKARIIETKKSEEEAIAIDKKVAQNFENRAMETITVMSFARAKDLSALMSIDDIYSFLTQRQKSFVEEGLIEKLNELIKQAKKDKEEQEEEEEEKERRRRITNNPNFSIYGNSSFGGRSSFTGFGGHSSGGGTSRKF